MDILFLDQNKWIELARVNKGSTNSSLLSQVYEQLKMAVDSGKIVIPLTASHIIETSKRNDSISRAHVVKVQARLSKGLVFRSRKARLLIEIRNALHLAFGEQLVKLPNHWAIATGFMQAFETYDQLVAKPSDSTATRLVNKYIAPEQQYIDYLLNQDDNLRREAQAALALESEVLLSTLEARKAIMSGATIDLRRRAYTAKTFIENQDLILKTLEEIGHTFDEFKQLGNTAIVKLMQEIPTLHVETELAARLEAQTGELEVNDIHDMQSFYTAIPYATILVAEKGFISLARQAKLDSRYKISLSTKLEELEGRYN